MRRVSSLFGNRFGLTLWCGDWGRRNLLVRLAAIHFLVGAAKWAEPLESLDQPKGQAGLLAPRAVAHDAIRTALSQCAGSVGDGFVAQDARVFSSGARWSSAGQFGGVLLDLADRFGDLVHSRPLRQQHGLAEPDAFRAELLVLRAILVALKPIRSE